MAKIIYIFLLISLSSFGQENDIDFLVEKIKVNYPGYAAKTDNIDFNQFVSKTISENKSDTFKAMATIVDFFKDRHLDLVRLKSSIQIDTILFQKNYIQNKKYFNNKGKKKCYEGYWLNDYNNCIMALKKVGPHKFIGYVCESRDSNLLFPGMAAYNFDSIAPNTFLTKFTSDYSGTMFYVRSGFRNDSVLITGANGKWKKLKVYVPRMISNLPLVSDEASAQLLDSNNFLITIPISTGSNAKIVDSLVKTNYQLISRTKNLIIDIRQNMGGTVRAYLPLLPFIYTKPIEKVNVAMYCSKDGIDQVRENIASYIKKGNIDSALLKDWQALVKMEEDSIGKFISGPTDTLRFDSVMTYPQNVGIIINYANQSAAEMMLLDCMQSSKVTLFGEHTMGAVDYLDYYPINLPSKKYQLKIAATKRIIPIEGSKLDYKGIYPNVKIQDSEKNWVDFVKTYYEKH
jgi:hypothetical protein